MEILGVVGIIAVFAILLILLREIAKQQLQIKELTRSVVELADSHKQNLALLESLSSQPHTSPLEGKRVGLCIEQDHRLPVIARLIGDRIEAEDGEVATLSPKDVEHYETATRWEPGRDAPHVVVKGKVRCNGYKDLYYEADLTFLFAYGVVESILESPPNGARQTNLAIAALKVIKQTMDTEERRTERRTALKELGG
jgi:hypothetical protein